MSTTLHLDKGGAAEWFDAWTGRFSAVSTLEGGRSRDGCRPAPRPTVQPRVVCFGHSGGADGAGPPHAAIVHRVADAGSRLVHVTRSDGGTVGVALGDWLKTAPTADYTGTLRYRVQFTVIPDAARAYRVGVCGTNVGDFAVARAEREGSGCSLWAHYSWDIAGALKEGVNELVIEVTNSLARRHDVPHTTPPVGTFRAGDARSLGAKESPGHHQQARSAR